MDWSVIGSIASTVAVIVTLVTFMIQWRRNKKVETLRALDEIYDAYYLLDGKEPAKDYRACVAYINKVNRFAIAFNGGVYDKKAVKGQASIFFKAQYDRFVRDIIEQRRKQFKRDNYYHDIVEMVNSIS